VTIQGFMGADAFDSDKVKGLYSMAQSIFFWFYGPRFFEKKVIG
jgi:hypothetical protein